MTKTKLTKVAAALVLALGSGSAMADSVTDTASPWSAAVNHDFSIVIPGFLFFRVGTDAAATVNTITFTATTANVGNSTAIAGTGGEAGGGSAANVVVRANVGQITITETNNSGGNGLGNGTAADGYIAYTQITTTSSDLPNLPAPALSNAGGTTALVALNGGSTKVTNRNAVWTYGYANTTVPAAGTYGAGGGTGGRVTYTATAP
jgi:hypothetical protein